MTTSNPWFAGIISVAFGLGPAAAQDVQQDPADENDRTTTIQLDERDGLPVPENLRDLKTLSLSLWIKFRGTGQHVYRFVNESAQFHAYTYVCKRHELNISQGPIIELANFYIQAAIPAHYEEFEYALLEALSKKQQQAFFDDMSGDLYAFEFGFRTAEQTRKIADSGKTKKVFCEGVKTEFKDSYIALRATALKRLKDFDRAPAPNSAN